MYKYFSPTSHSRNIKKAKKKLSLLRSFEGDYKSAQQFAFMRKLKYYIFEEMLLTCFEERGIKIKRNKRYTGDGGLDGKIWLNGKLVLIQAKRYGKHITAEHVKKFIILAQKNKAKGLFIHTGKTGKKSWGYSKSPLIEIVSGNKLLTLINGQPIRLFGKEYSKSN